MRQIGRFYGLLQLTWHLGCNPYLCVTLLFWRGQNIQATFEVGWIVFSYHYLFGEIQFFLWHSGPWLKPPQNEWRQRYLEQMKHEKQTILDLLLDKTILQYKQFWFLFSTRIILEIQENTTMKMKKRLQTQKKMLVNNLLIIVVYQLSVYYNFELAGPYQSR